MRKLLFVLLLLVAGVVALGFYRGWFVFERTHDPETGRQGVQFEVDQNKAKPDIDNVKKKIGDETTAHGQKPEGQKP